MPLGGRLGMCAAFCSWCGGSSRPGRHRRPCWRSRHDHHRREWHVDQLGGNGELPPADAGDADERRGDCASCGVPPKGACGWRRPLVQRLRLQPGPHAVDAGLEPGRWGVLGDLGVWALFSALGLTDPPVVWGSSPPHATGAGRRRTDDDSHDAGWRKDAGPHDVAGGSVRLRV